jgi:hypothetical protein
MKLLELKVKGLGNLSVKIIIKDNCKYVQKKWDVELIGIFVF